MRRYLVSLVTQKLRYQQQRRHITIPSRATQVLRAETLRLHHLDPVVRRYGHSRQRTRHNELEREFVVSKPGADNTSNSLSLTYEARIIQKLQL